MVESIIMVVLVALVCIGAVTVFGQQVFHLYDIPTQTVGGEAAPQETMGFQDY